MTTANNSTTPATAGGSKASLQPIKSTEENHFGVLLLIVGTIKIIFGLLFGIVFLVIFLLVTITGIGPLIEYCQSKRDEKEALNHDVILQAHPEMFLLDVPGDINKASGGMAYRVMVRLTKPTSDDDTNNANNLPPVIFPGGLASNLMTMSRHQDELTKQHGFTVVNFDRLGVGLSDPYPTNFNRQPPSAADVAREMNFVMSHCESVLQTKYKWICVGGSMGANVATAFMTLYPNRIGGFFNLDGLPHAFLQIQCKKFLKDGQMIMNMMRRLRWTGLPRLAFRLALQSTLPVMGDAFTTRQLIGVMCRDQFFVATGLEYTTLMSCCDLECAAWGKQATTECNDESLRLLASLAPDESVIINEGKGIIPRIVTTERSKSELGATYLTRADDEFMAFEETFRLLALNNPDDVDKTKTHCNWPTPPKHPVGNFVGGVESDTSIIYPLAPQFKTLVVRILCARDYTGLERDYTQEARNHAAARCTLQTLMSDDGKVYYYPRLSHLNLWQQVTEVVAITFEMSTAIQEQECKRHF
ncbi:alpha/beta hydrolase family protein [Skeletonema marinoi]|uniref:Alpha/beta hydrolase family protein n=1 Tax=Skeletonema marinoi TaxID=267567 RepID=A0AAD8Y395_9STRA|nr:alpha/beta hydrolase family protein [Skeletonema marinoi]